MPSPGRDFTRTSPACSKKRHKFYLQRMEDMVDFLRDKLEQLSSKKRRIEMRLKAEESAYKKRTNKVTEWLYKVDTVGAEVDRLIIEAEGELAQRRTVGCCPWNRRPTSILHLNVYEKLKVVHQLLTADDFDVVVQRTPHRHVEVIPVEPTVDFESNLDDVWRCLKDERLQVIGIFGMAGVGKTTLLKKIKDGIQKERMDVIWLWASKKKRAIEKDMAKQLAVLRNANKRASDGDRVFVVLIDDLWGTLDLSNILAPHLNGSGYRVVFTTRSEAVCDDMAAVAKLKLNCLSGDEALKLFWMNAGSGIRDSFPWAQQLADYVNASLCQGLPLALVAYGRALSGMQNLPFAEFSGLKHVFHVLQPSYDNLDHDMIRRLFLYCSILPGKIRKDELIRLWIGEGFVDISDKNRGEYFVRKLEKACLLEYDEFNDSVSMHSVIRSFGLHLCRERVETENNILVQESKPENLHDADRISMDGEIDIATFQWSCPKLLSLFIRNSNLITFPTDFFQSMHCLEVLNLSKNDKLAELPTSIGSLTNLHYLSLSFTGIKELPAELKLLKGLKVLLADYTKNLKTIPVGVIPSISSLKVFSKLGDEIYNDIMLLEELKGFEAMDEINVSLFTHEAVEKLLDSPKLQNCIRKLTLKNIKSLKIPVSVLSKMVQLENLEIANCTDIHFEMDESCYHVLSIQGLWIRNCSEIDNLRWLIFAPGLKVLALHSCESLVEVIGSDFAPEEIKEIDERLGILSNLKRIHLENLYSLLFICPQVLQFPALRDVNIINCTKLSVLPFDANDVSNKPGGRCQRLENMPIVPVVAAVGNVPESPISPNGSQGSDVFDVGQVNASKKRKTMPIWTDHVRVRPESGQEEPHDDGYSWRKYGQKDILNSKYPRSYYRCTYRNTQGCWATKQVQRSNNDPTVFEITYRGVHTCSLGQQQSTSPEKHHNASSNSYQQQQLPQDARFNFRNTLRMNEDIKLTGESLIQEKADLVRSGARPSQSKGKETLASPGWKGNERERGKERMSFVIKTEILDDGYEW